MPKRLSPATVIALVALFVALTGTGTAAVLITSAQIKNGTIQVVDLSKRAQTALRGHRGERGPAGPQGVQGPVGPQGPAGQSAGALFAIVAPDASIIKASGATGVTRTPLGRYTITFTRDVTDCAAVASTGTRGTTDSNQVPVGVASTSVSGNKVVVVTKKWEQVSGHLEPEDVGFHVAVFC